MRSLSPSRPLIRSDFSVEPLLEFWRGRPGAPDLDRADPDELFGALVAPADRDRAAVAVVAPLDFEPRWATEPFRALLASADHEYGGHTKDRHEKLSTMYRFVLNRVYGLDLGPLPSPVFETLQDGLVRFHRVTIDLRWCRVETGPKLPKLTPELRRALLEAGNDPGRLQSLVPLELFRLTGFGVLSVADITAAEAVSRLKLLLIEADSITDPRRYARIQDLTRSVLGKAEPGLFLAAYRDDRVLMLHEDYLAEDRCILMASHQHSREEFEDTVFGNTYRQGRPYAFPVLEDGRGDAALQELYDQGVRSVVTTPLTIGDTAVGLAVLASEQPEALTAGDLDGLADVLPLLALGVRRSVEDLDRRVQRLIQKNFTAIHPAVAWKFQREATRAMLDRTGQLGEILFENVWPLYAASDIRNSSTHRSQAILSDLREQLDQGARIVEAARDALALPILDELAWRVKAQRELLSDGLNAGDEISVLNFLRRELEPTFGELEKAGPAAEALVAAYRQSVHPEARSVYRRRKDFDESVRTLNEAVSELLDREQAEAQFMFPHYFDKNTTDGVDQNIYLGPSLMPDGRWDPLYLKNLRLWQFLSLAKIARLASDLRPRLAVPLDLTHLIMVQDLPITIRFRSDERKFNVDGAYNIRYEIMKKRIDKATVRGTGERLTQPATIAVVFSQLEEAADYRQFIAWLTAEGWLEAGTEELELDDLQGIHGLKALRVRVKLG